MDRYESSRPKIGEEIIDISTGKSIGRVTHFCEVSDVLYLDRLIPGTEHHNTIIWRFTNNLNILHTWESKKE